MVMGPSIMEWVNEPFLMTDLAFCRWSRNHGILRKPASGKLDLAVPMACSRPPTASQSGPRQAWSWPRVPPAGLHPAAAT